MIFGILLFAGVNFTSCAPTPYKNGSDYKAPLSEAQRELRDAQQKLQDSAKHAKQLHDSTLSKDVERLKGLSFLIE